MRLTIAYMQFIILIITIGLVIVGAFMYLNREPCVECAGAKKEYCATLLKPYITQDGEYALSYLDRIRMSARGCI